MNVKHTDQLSSRISSRRLFVRKRDIIDSTPLPFTSLTTAIEPLRLLANENCCGRKEKKTKVKTIPKGKQSVISIPIEPIVHVPKQTTIREVISLERIPRNNEVLDNAWPLSNERVENMMITNKRCYFSNEAVTIKPITAVPGIGKKYGQILADHGFIYARQLLGYYLMLKDSEMFRKWLEYQFHIPTFRAAEITSALNELIRQTL